MSINSETLYGGLSSIPQTSCSEKQQIINTILNEELKEKRKPHEIDILRQKLKDKALLIDKSYSSAKFTKKVKKKKREYKLTQKTRRLKELNLHDIPKEGQKYEYFKPLNNLWIQYVTSKFSNQDGIVKKLNADDRLLKMDYHGAFMTVVNSKCKSYIGIKGIVAKETKYVLMLVTQENTLKKIPKKGSIFMFEVQGYRVKINGDAIVGRPGVRISKKFKSEFNSELLLNC